MKRKSPWLSFTACALSAAAVAAPLQAEPASVSETASIQDFSDVQVIPFPNGKVGFFKRSTGTLYIYNSFFSACYAVLKVNQLGGKIEVVEGSPSAADVAFRK
ncbi:MAG: hypothetical protein ACFUZC_18105 [Chthoniobacteraceae bacterium]